MHVPSLSLPSSLSLPPSLSLPFAALLSRATLSRATRAAVVAAVFLFAVGAPSAADAEADTIAAGGTTGATDDPLALRFQRLAARRFVFSAAQNIPLAEFAPAEIVDFASMHPAFAVNTKDVALPDPTFAPKIAAGKLVFDASCKRGGGGAAGVCFYVGAVNPVATYELDIAEISAAGSATGGTTVGDVAEVGIDLARNGLRDRVQLLVRESSTAGAADKRGVFLRVVKNGVVQREHQFKNSEKKLPPAPFKLRMQLLGRSFLAYIEKDGVTTTVGGINTHEKNAKSPVFHFGDVLDFRRIETARECTFNVVSNLRGKTVVAGARAVLSTGNGQADVRNVTYEDGTPLFENGRLWFTMTCRGSGLPDQSQGVFSLNPSVFDLKFEGMLVFDFGDGLLRNTVGTHLFYDRAAGEWRAASCDFGGSKNTEGRSKSHLFFARSKTDPRRGFRVMQAWALEKDKINGTHEDPFLFFDAAAGKWRMLTSSFRNGIVAQLFEADKWDGPFRAITKPLERNSTGTTVQKIGGKFYCLMGGEGENLRVHSYPDLKFLGHLNLDLQPHWPRPARRVWANIVPLPAGYPYRCILLTMDRVNFPALPAPTWSYGSLYFYGAR